MPTAPVLLLTGAVIILVLWLLFSYVTRGCVYKLVTPTCSKHLRKRIKQMDRQRWP